MHHGITINTGLGLSVGCCIPAVLSMASIWLKLVREKLASLATLLPNWNSDDSESQSNMQAASTDEIHRHELLVTPDEKRRHDEKKMDDIIRIGLGLVERVVFSAVILAIVILGERNFWSAEMRVGVEPMSSVGELIYFMFYSTSFFFYCFLTIYISGQWAPILGAIIGALGSWYTSTSDSRTTILPIHRPDNSNGKATCEHIEHYAGEMSQTSTFAANEVSYPEPAHHPDRNSSSPIPPPTSESVSHRTKVTRAVHRVGIWLTPAPDRFVDDIMLTEGHDQYREYPHTPGEEAKNPYLSQQDRLHRESVQSFDARASPPRTPLPGLGQPGPSKPHTSSSVPSASPFLPVPSQERRTPPHRQASLPTDDGDVTGPPTNSMSLPEIVVTDADI